MLTTRAIRRSSDKNITGKQLMEKDDYLFSDADGEIKNWCEKYAISGYDKGSDIFHYKFLRFNSPPCVLYRKGDISLLDRPLLAIVGPRIPSGFLISITKDLFGLLAGYRIATISGGAEGIDCLAHECSIEQQLPTIVVLGGGFRWYKKNRIWQFFEKIVAAGGLIISERKLDQSPAVYTFPQRNRIIAGISDVVFLPGAAKGSGSLITVDFALQFGIPVVTVPGSYYEQISSGSNEYLCHKKISGTIDIAGFLKQYFGHCANTTNMSLPILVLSEEEKQLLSLLTITPLPLGALIDMLNRNLPLVLEILLGLEIKQLVYSPEPGCYACKN